MVWEDLKDLLALKSYMYYESGKSTRFMWSTQAKATVPQGFKTEVHETDV